MIRLRYYAHMCNIIKIYEAKKICQDLMEQDPVAVAR
jgi:hypothetical protein